MRPAVEKLREELNTPYPLASAKTWLAVEGRELVRKVEETVGLHRRLRLVVVRNDQEMLAWSPQAQELAESLHWDQASSGAGGGGQPVITSLNPDPTIRDVVVNPLQRFGEPSELYELPTNLVEAAVRYELKTAGAYAALAG